MKLTMGCAIIESWITLSWSTHQENSRGLSSSSSWSNMLPNKVCPESRLKSTGNSKQSAIAQFRSWYSWIYARHSTWNAKCGCINNNAMWWWWWWRWWWRMFMTQAHNINAQTRRLRNSRTRATETSSTTQSPMETPAVLIGVVECVCACDCGGAGDVCAILALFTARCRIPESIKCNTWNCFHCACRNSEERW